MFAAAACADYSPQGISILRIVRLHETECAVQTAYSVLYTTAALIRMPVHLRMAAALCIAISLLSSQHPLVRIEVIMASISNNHPTPAPTATPVPKPTAKQICACAKRVLGNLDATQAEREALYKEFHNHPELAFLEEWTSQRIFDDLTSAHIEVVRIGKTGLVARIKNGDGPCVCMRADIDGLPVKEASGKPYASTFTMTDPASGAVVPMTHACGHDFHIMSLLSALHAFAAHKDAWHGTFMGVFQPAEEVGQGALSLIREGLCTQFEKPDVYLGQHVMPTLPSGCVATKVGPFFSAAYSIRITLHGKGSHGSMPELGIDPVVLAASVIMRLQTIVSREMPSDERVVLTIGSVSAGSKANIIPDTAVLLLNTRTYNAQLEKRLFAAIERIVRAECDAAGCTQPPDIEYFDRGPLTSNDAQTTPRVQEAFAAYFGEHALLGEPQSVSEDFSYIPDEWGCPYTFWTLGGFADVAHAPANHSPHFTPDLQPTLNCGVSAVVVAASAWLAS